MKYSILLGHEAYSLFDGFFELPSNIDYTKKSVQKCFCY